MVDYKYIYAWNPDETGEDNKPVTRCSTPSISYESGKLMFACETTGAKYHYTITDTDIKSDVLSENGELSLYSVHVINNTSHQLSQLRACFMKTYY